MNSLTAIGLALVIGAVLGGAIAWLIAKLKQGAQLAARHERVLMLEQALEQLRGQHEEDTRTLERLNQQAGELGRELATATTRLEEERKQTDEKIKLLREMSEGSKKALTEEFQNLANTILEDKTRRFTEQNQQNLGQLLTPFKERLNEFKAKVEEIHYHDTQQQAAMKVELAQLKELNKQMTEEAHDLATALKGQAKKQGNWGELILDNVLARSGLQEGSDYRREVSFNTEEGKQRPDVIIYLPQKKHLIVDAKVSLNAYTRYVNAEDEVERKQALREHVAAIAQRITELADRRYFDLGEINSPEMVGVYVCAHRICFCGSPTC
ncbi:MAG: DNA recombination protein RmuC [Burkholderiales bacterium]|nr:DNA recombination protein RmuC [Burkholderiales bacterium]